MEIKRHIPNMITMSNLLLGVLSLISATRGEMLWAGAFIFLATIPDFLDGMMARMLNVTSDVGKDLDSLADMVSFGVAPAVMLYQLEMYYNINWIPYLVLLLPLFSALRLAKFNNDDRQSSEFYGLPTPSVALFLASWPFMIEYDVYGFEPILTHPVTFVVIPLLLSVLMVSDIRLFSLKFKHFRFVDNRFRYLLILCALLLIVFFRFLAIPIIILLYIVLSIIRNFAR